MSVLKSKTFFTGGLAEIVSNPSPITYSFLKQWFCGKGSIGIGMGILGLPCELISKPLLELKESGLVVDLGNEEDTFYKNTVFSYISSNHPTLRVNIKKVFSMTSIFNTLKMIYIQSMWISFPSKIIFTLKTNVTKIDEISIQNDVEKINSILKKSVVPLVFATDYVCEYFHEYLKAIYKSEISNIDMIVSSQVQNEDWIFRSISDQFLVKSGDLTFHEFMGKYGVRADDDYELTLPRWHEIPETIQKRINQLPEQKPKVKNLAPNSIPKLVLDYIELLKLRSEVKRKALIHIDALRQALLKDVMYRDKLIVKSHHKYSKQATIKLDNQQKGQGIGVSSGIVGGKILYIESNEVEIPVGTIGIFPNASPLYTTQFPKCHGIVFLKGGMTSHGSIVAREFGIPAIIDQSFNINNGKEITIYGDNGSWKVN